MTTKHLFLMVAALGAFAHTQAITWTVQDRDGLHIVQPAYVDSLLLSIPDEKVGEASRHIAIRAVKMDNGEYALHAHVRGLGGGPIFAAITAVTVLTGGVVVLLAEAATTGPVVFLHAPAVMYSTITTAKTLSELALIAPTA